MEFVAKLFGFCQKVWIWLRFWRCSIPNSTFLHFEFGHFWDFNCVWIYWQIFNETSHDKKCLGMIQSFPNGNTFLRTYKLTPNLQLPLISLMMVFSINAIIHYWPWSLVGGLPQMLLPIHIVPPIQYFTLWSYEQSLSIWFVIS